MEKIVWVIGSDRLEMIEAQQRINAAGSMRALCLLSFDAVKKAAQAQERGEQSRISTPSLIVLDYQTEKQEDFASLQLLREQKSLGGVPLFFMVGKRSEELDEECYSRGATVVVHKPFSRAGIMRIERTAWQHEATKNYEKMLQKQAGDLLAAKEIMRLNQQLQSRNQLLHQIFGRYFSDNVVEDILENPQGAVVGGEKRELTVMMADLRGFTAMSETMSPDMVADLLNCFFEHMLQCIAKYHGVVIEFLGDAILAVYGASPESVHQIEEGIAAGIEMQNAMRTVNEYSASLGYPSLEMGIGIHSGEVFIGNVGSEKMMRYNVIGQVVNECSRIEGVSVGGQVMVSANMVEKAQASVMTQGKITIQVKGISKPLEVCMVTGVKAPYDSYLEKQEDTCILPEQLAKGISCRLRCIEDERIADRILQGVITHFAEKRAWVTMDDEDVQCLSLYSDLELQLCESEDGRQQAVYAKIIQMAEGRILVHFTYSNPQFAERMKQEILAIR
ncbi:MAG: adenylate/guanylate cyclase domain-containing protein [Lachnospiraceae bacterium]|nr:adenylate/guanylate cyclase domain-containing protein [Lachnospiraceae bacterium]